MRAASRERPAVAVAPALGAIVVLAAALRFSTLGVQSFWLDEAYTRLIAKLALGDVWHQIKTSEGTPPLYYYLAYASRHVSGASEVGLRSLSAVIGTLTVPAAFYAARELVSRRAGLVCALLVAVNPWLIWYSQEARAYALLVLVSTVALVFFARAARTGSRRDVVLWAVVAAVAVCSHYFAVFTIAPEAAWLLYVWQRERRPLRPLLFGFAGVAVVCGALVPLARDQRHGDRQAFIHDLPRSTRLEDFVRHPLAGELGGPVHGFVQAAGVLALIAAALVLFRAGPRERRGALLALGIAVMSVAIPFVLSFTSLDYLFARNSMAAVVPALVFIAAGLAVPSPRWLGFGVLAGLCALWLAVDIATPLDKKLQRDDWRGAVRALGPASSPRVVVTAPSFLDVPLTTYLHPAARVGPPGAVAAELDLIRLRRGSQAAAPPVAITGFTLVGVKRTVSYELLRYRAPVPVRITAATLAGLKPSSVAFFQR
ncbi:MAG: glycosyltransferase family 39 protein [Thermoleophilaceae bacterium]